MTRVIGGLALCGLMIAASKMFPDHPFRVCGLVFIANIVGYAEALAKRLEDQ